jgi:hypothetical protein
MAGLLFARERDVFVGHYGASFAGKAMERRIPLWVLFLAVQWIDVLWSIFVLLGIEKVRIVPGITASNALDLYYMPYTHSLVAALAWSGFGFVACQMVRRLRGVGTGIIVAAAVFSHWILDLIVHRPDLAIFKSWSKMGLSVWNYRAAAFALEMAVLFVGAALLYLESRHRGRLIAFVLLLAAIQVYGTFFLPPPPSDHAAALSALSSYVGLALIAVWVDWGASRPEGGESTRHGA